MYLHKKCQLLKNQPLVRRPLGSQVKSRDRYLIDKQLRRLEREREITKIKNLFEKNNLESSLCSFHLITFERLWQNRNFILSFCMWHIIFVYFFTFDANVDEVPNKDLHRESKV